MPTISPRNSVFRSEGFKKLSQTIRTYEEWSLFFSSMGPAYLRDEGNRERLHQLYSIVIPIQWQSHSLVYKIEKRQVNPVVIKKAAERLKPGKGDPCYSFSSDCIKVKSMTLWEYTAVMIKSFLVHGYLPVFILLSTLIPVIKDRLAYINILKNYWSCIISSLILKQFDQD